MSMYKDYNKIVGILRGMDIPGMDSIITVLDERAALLPSVNIVFCRDCKNRVPCESPYGFKAKCKVKSDGIRTYYVGNEDVNHCEHGAEKDYGADKKDTIYTHDEAALIIELFEDVLDEHDITLTSPEDDDREPENGARLYGSVYSDLMDSVENTLIEAFETVQTGGQPDVYQLAMDVFTMFINTANRDEVALPESDLGKQVLAYLEKLLAAYGPQTKIIEDEFSGEV